PTPSSTPPASASVKHRSHHRKSEQHSRPPAWRNRKPSTEGPGNGPFRRDQASARDSCLARPLSGRRAPVRVAALDELRRSPKILLSRASLRAHRRRERRKPPCGIRSPTAASESELAG